MNFEIPLADSGRLISANGSYTVWQDDKFYWVQEGADIQSVMSIDFPAELVLPTHRLMYVATELVGRPRSILNLGFGVGSLERKLQSDFPNVDCTSVDVSRELTEIAQQFFFLDNAGTIVIAKAEDYLAATSQKYDVIFIDLFAAGLNASCLYEGVFYKNLVSSMHEQSVAAINLIPHDEPDLLKILLPLRQYLPQVALAQIEGRKNIVLVAGNSLHASLPDQAQARHDKLSESPKQVSWDLTAFTQLPEPSA